MKRKQIERSLMKIFGLAAVYNAISYILAADIYNSKINILADLVNGLLTTAVSARNISKSQVKSKTRL